MQCNKFKIGDKVKYYNDLYDCYKYGFINDINTNKIEFFVDDLCFDNFSDVDIVILRAFGYEKLAEVHQLILLKIPDYFYEQI